MSRSPATLPPTWIDPIFVVPSCANRKKGVCGPPCTPKFHIYVAHTSWARFTINTTKTSLRLVDERGIRAVTFGLGTQFGMERATCASAAKIS